MQSIHQTVLLHEAANGLGLAPGDRALDATLGVGGHTRLLAKAVGPGGRVLALEADAEVAAKTKSELAAEGYQVEVVVGNFRDLDTLTRSAGISEVQGVVFDLGWNSEQLVAGRGFSFSADEPLLMTYRSSIDEGTLTAQKVVNTWSEADLVDVLRELGEERHAARIAKAIISARAQAPITRANELGDLVASVVPRGRTHAATKTFQALRLVVNNELGALTEALPKALALLAPRGRLAVITFHSLEDRVAKRIFQRFAKEGSVRLVTKKPLTPTRAEVLTNRRARSAKLRIIEKI